MYSAKEIVRNLPRSLGLIVDLCEHHPNLVRPRAAKQHPRFECLKQDGFVCTASFPTRRGCSLILGANPAAPRRRLSRLFYCERSKINGDNRSQIKICGLGSRNRWKTRHGQSLKDRDTRLASVFPRTLPRGKCAHFPISASKEVLHHEKAGI